MQIKYFSKADTNPYLSDIKNILVCCDNEFVPPLSTRKSTTQADLINHSSTPLGFDSYYEEISNQSVFVAIIKGKVVAFMSFREDYVCEHISNVYLPNIYITTVIVHPEYRRKNIAGSMYDLLIENFPKQYLFTRTWSTNLSHIRILFSKGFQEHFVLENDRGYNINTVYFRKNPEKSVFIMNNSRE